MIDKIRDIAYAVVEAFTKNKTPLNDAILQVSDTIENEEVLKRVCELVNQNVYLSLFHAPGADRSNIVFDVADFEKIKQGMSKMNDYAIAPSDFRKTLTITAVPVEMEPMVDKTAVINNKYQLLEERDSLKRAADVFLLMKTAEINSVEENFNKLLKDSIAIVHQGESLGDMAKIASRNVIEMGLSPEKVMSIYSDVSKLIANEGYHVREDFTKISSQKINPKSEILQPSKEIALSIEKIGALNQMLNKINTIIEGYNVVIKS
jgi:predicted regulator of amino acid metabolism with ACT domain